MFIIVLLCMDGLYSVIWKEESWYLLLDLLMGLEMTWVVIFVGLGVEFIITSSEIYATQFNEFSPVSCKA